MDPEFLLQQAAFAITLALAPLRLFWPNFLSGFFYKEQTTVGNFIISFFLNNTLSFPLQDWGRVLLVGCPGVARAVSAPRPYISQRVASLDVLPFLPTSTPVMARTSSLPPPVSCPSLFHSLQKESLISSPKRVDFLFSFNFVTRKAFATL